MNAIANIFTLMFSVLSSLLSLKFHHNDEIEVCRIEAETYEEG